MSSLNEGTPPFKQQPIKEEVTLNDICRYVHNTLKIAGEYKLQVEVIASAFDSLKENPNQSISEALDYGLNEWIK